MYTCTCLIHSPGVLICKQCSTVTSKEHEYNTALIVAYRVKTECERDGI